MPIEEMNAAARTYKRELRIVGLIILALVILAVPLIYAQGQAAKYRKLREALHTIQLAVERFAVDTEGSYPRDLHELEQKGYVKEWPDNPFRPGKVKLLKPGDPWEPGGIVYTGWGPIIAIEKGQKGTIMFGAQPKSGQSIHPSVPTEIDQYILAAYGPRRTPRRAKAMAEARRELEQAKGAMAAGKEVPLPIYADGIDWGHVELMLTAGEDYQAVR